MTSILLNKSNFLLNVDNSITIYFFKRHFILNGYLNLLSTICGLREMQVNVPNLTFLHSVKNIMQSICFIKIFITICSKL